MRPFSAAFVSTSPTFSNQHHSHFIMSFSQWRSFGLFFHTGELDVLIPYVQANIWDDSCLVFSVTPHRQSFTSPKSLILLSRPSEIPQWPNYAQRRHDCDCRLPKTAPKLSHSLYNYSFHALAGSACHRYLDVCDLPPGIRAILRDFKFFFQSVG